MKADFYVAGKYEDPAVDDVMTLVHKHGHNLTLDWKELEAFKPYEDFAEDNSSAAEAMIDAVVEANVLILVGYDGLYGAMVELGAALASDTEVWFYMPDVEVRYSIFMFHPAVDIVGRPSLEWRLETLARTETEWAKGLF